MAPQPRPYQRKQVNEVYDQWKAGNSRVMNVLPTGGGKTVEMGLVASEMITGQALGQPFAGVAIAHRKELIGQISKSMASFGVEHNIIAAARTVSLCVSLHVQNFGKSFYRSNARLTVSSVDTLISRKDRLVQWAHGIGFWMIDEGHHCLPDNKWGKAIEMFGSAVGAGFTATPLRADRKSLARVQGGIFDTMVIGPSMRELIDAGSLCDYRIIAPPASIDRSEIQVGSTGDFVQASLKKVVHESKIVGDIVKHYLRFAAGKRGICFVVDVEQSVEVANAFNAAGIRAAAVDGTTPETVRDSLMAKFAAGQLDILVNVDLFGEGLDVPAVEVVIMARPTESYGLYAQQFGRALRVLSGKLFGIIIDHVGNVRRHGLPDVERTWSLISDVGGKRQPKDPDDIPVTTCLNPECFKAYEAVSATCPFCGFRPEPASRGRPEFVDGDLFELDPQVLAEMRGQVKRVDGDVLIPRGATPEIAAAIRRRWGERREAQKDLRYAISLWAGVWRDRNAADPEIHRRFYHLFGVDIMTAQTLGAEEADKLRDRINDTYR